MKIRNLTVYLCTAVLFLGVVLLLVYQLSIPHELNLSFSVRGAEGEKEIEVWFDGENKYYAFLPSYAQLSQIEININSDCKVYLNGDLLKDGTLCSDVDTDNGCELSFKSFGRTYKRELLFLSSAGMNTMYIDTASSGMEYIHNDKQYEESGKYLILSSDGSVLNQGDITSIGGHGNTTWEEYDKKSYSFTLTEDDGLIGMGEAQRWILLANADDPSNIRDKMVYDFASDFGLEFSPESKWVDLYLNGEYVGLYLLCERNEVQTERVNIEDEGSFLVSLELDSRLEKQELPRIYTDGNQTFRVHYPLELTEDNINNIKSTMNSIESALTSDDGVDPVTGKHWSEMIDTDSWARKYLIEEFFGNLDAGFISQYFYFDGSTDSNVVFAGPVWDYGYSMGNEYVWQLSNAESVFADRLEVKNGYTSPWFYYLMRDESFSSEVYEIYETQFLPLFQVYCDNGIPNYENEISSSASLNQIRWFDYNESVDYSIDYVTDYLLQRMSFLEEYWSGDNDYHSVCADKVISGNYAYFAVRDGECLNSLPVFEDIDGYEFCGWIDSSTGEAFDITQPISSDVFIYADWHSDGTDMSDTLIKLAPIGLISVVFFILLAVEIRRMRGNV